MKSCKSKKAIDLPDGLLSFVEDDDVDAIVSTLYGLDFVVFGYAIRMLFPESW